MVVNTGAAVIVVGVTASAALVASTTLVCRVLSRLNIVLATSAGGPEDAKSEAELAKLDAPELEGMPAPEGQLTYDDKPPSF